MADNSKPRSYAGSVDFPAHAARNPKLKDESDADYLTRLTAELGIGLRRSDARDTIKYFAAHDAATKKGVPVVMLEDDPVHDNAVKLTRAQARDAQTYRKALAGAQAKGVPLVVLDE